MAYIGIGSNLENPIYQVKTAVAEISRCPDIRLVKQSSWYQTAPWGGVAQPDFINGVIAIETTFSALQLLAYLQGVEKQQGRSRSESVPWGPRLIDLDILLYGDKVIHTETLCVPHPYLKEREFVLYPLAEIDKNLVLPTGESVECLKSQCMGRDITPLKENRP